MGIAVRSTPSSLDQLLGLLARCSLPPAADRSRRLSAPRGSPGPWLGIVRLKRTMPAGSLCDAGLMRRAPGTRPPNASARPSRPCTGLPIRRGTPPEDAETLRLGTVDSRAFIAVLPSFPHVCIPAAAWGGGLHTSAQLCVDPSIYLLFITHVAGLSRRRTGDSGDFSNYDCDDVE